MHFLSYEEKMESQERQEISSNVIITFLIRFYAKTLNVMRGVDQDSPAKKAKRQWNFSLVQILP